MAEIEISVESVRVAHHKATAKQGERTFLSVKEEGTGNVYKLRIPREALHDIVQPIADEAVEARLDGLDKEVEAELVLLAEQVKITQSAANKVNRAIRKAVGARKAAKSSGTGEPEARGDNDVRVAEAMAPEA